MNQAHSSSSMPRRPPSPPDGWRKIRPWNKLTLVIREVTPVSVTFLLSSYRSQFTQRQLSFDNEMPSTIQDDHTEGSTQTPPQPNAKSVSEILGQGLAVKVNDTPWQRVVLQNDTNDEASIVIYGLHPSRQYNVELGLVEGTQETSISSHVVTEHTISDNEDEEENVPALPVLIPNGTQPLTPDPSRPSTPDNQNLANSSDMPASPRLVRPLTTEEQAAQLLGTLRALAESKETLLSHLKVARRDSQKADAALRAEVEALKRASEKSSGADLRSRQKLKALQEATKQSLAASVEMDAMVKKLTEEDLPLLEAKLKTVEAEYSLTGENFARHSETVAENVKKDRKHVSDLEAELASLHHRRDKMNAKRDKLSEDVVPNLEATLQNLGKEIDRIEAEASESHRTPGVDGQAVHHHVSRSHPPSAMHPPPDPSSPLADIFPTEPSPTRRTF